MAWNVTCADVVEWAKSYTGPRFHGALLDPPYVFSKRKEIDRSARVLLPENPTMGQVLAAYHSIQQWGDTGMMNRSWDSGVAFNPETWAALAEHMLPGAFGLSFASARGWHRMATAIEDAGLIIHPSIFNWNIPAILGWAYGQGWPKGVRVRNGTIPKEDRPVIREVGEVGYASASTGYEEGAWSGRVTGEITDVEHVFAGHRYGLQTLKPALEPIILWQKPYGGRPYDVITGTGAGALWIDGARIACEQGDRETGGQRDKWNGAVYGKDETSYKSGAHVLGRVPANLVITHHPECVLLGTKQVKNTSGSTSGDEPSARTALVYGEYDRRQSFAKHGDENGIETIEDWECHEDCPVKRLGEQHGYTSSTGGYAPSRTLGGNGTYNGGDIRARFQYGDDGAVTRYFQCPGWALEVAMQLAATDSIRYATKAGKPERLAGLEGFFWKKDKGEPTGYVQVDRETWEGLSDREGKRGNVHPTVKPVSLTLWLARLLLPPAVYAPRRLLVPFSGSGSEIIGAVLAGWEHITGIELLDDTARLSRPRITWWEQWADALGVTDPAEILAEYRARKKAAQGDDGPEIEVMPLSPRRHVEQMGLWGAG